MSLRGIALAMLSASGTHTRHVSFQQRLTRPIALVAADFSAPIPPALVTQAPQCPRNMDCGPMDLTEETVYVGEPIVEYLPRIHTFNKTHSITETSYKAVVELATQSVQGICEKFVPVTSTVRPTVTAWIDTTTTAHYYTTETTVTTELTTTHTAVIPTACYQGIGKQPDKPFKPVTCKSDAPVYSALSNQDTESDAPDYEI
ncbi:uncharacterized protein KY384_002479 [Bacidia gigantensis]|uniref:uncharacterized protein n=1 Tax=Bacidia gigantensis TaxID=2732470 RepID=UPI001D04DDE9|nr:uncharacterized protein KY384_002479 [Bacidia gigantensis]KAG8532602.1 hypothetical protein KY384_002479 [Bacidia gigantensis]